MINEFNAWLTAVVVTTLLEHSALVLSTCATHRLLVWGCRSTSFARVAGRPGDSKQEYGTPADLAPWLAEHCWQDLRLHETERSWMRKGGGRRDWGLGPGLGMEALGWGWGWRDLKSPADRPRQGARATMHQQAIHRVQPVDCADHKIKTLVQSAGKTRGQWPPRTASCRPSSSGFCLRLSSTDLALQDGLPRGAGHKHSRVKLISAQRGWNHPQGRAASRSAQRRAATTPTPTPTNHHHCRLSVVGLPAAPKPSAIDRARVLPALPYHPSPTPRTSETPASEVVAAAQAVRTMSCRNINSRALDW